MVLHCRLLRLKIFVDKWTCIKLSKNQFPTIPSGGNNYRKEFIMITPIQMYWLTRLDGISIALATVLALLSAIIFVMTIAGAALRDYSRTEEEHATGKKLHKVATRLVCPWLLSLACLVFVPTTKEAAAIIIVPAVANSEKVQTVGNKLYDLTMEWMNELRFTTEHKGEADGSKQ